jgi:translation initiation factor IF-2
MKHSRSNARKSQISTHALRRRLETLEDRTVPSVSISVAGRPGCPGCGPAGRGARPAARPRSRRGTGRSPAGPPGTSAAPGRTGRPWPAGPAAAPGWRSAAGRGGSRPAAGRGRTSRPGGPPRSGLRSPRARGLASLSGPRHGIAPKRTAIPLVAQRTGRGTAAHEPGPGRRPAAVKKVSGSAADRGLGFERIKGPGRLVSGAARPDLAAPRRRHPGLCRCLP